ncbi:HAD family hydrolase [Metabacillus herbersteinensis]|uniref:HAD family hydrolase n=1 Tax=Metabacillus herbersteinensis TaxID=283816 RepID=A0ABV6G8T6_9BACI
MPIKAIVFDMDDTLYYESDYVRSGMNELGKWVNENYNIDAFYKIAMNFFEKGERKYIINKTLDLLMIPYNEKLIQKMISIYRSHKPTIQLLNDSKWVLENLEKNIKVGLISDGYFIAQTNKVHSLGIKDKFQSIILTDQFGRNNWKPSHKPYEQMCLNLQVCHDECVYVGDNVKKDFITAKKLGWKTVHIERETGIYAKITETPEYMAHYKINNLRELLDILEFQHLFNTHCEEAFDS